MLVREYMSANPMTVFPGTTCSDALQLMLAKDMDTLPVVTETGELAGIVTKKDLLYALPSSAALLSVSEIDGLFGNFVVGRVMTRRVISVPEGCPLEEAARILVDHKIGSLPVVHNNRLAGMITKAELLRAMMEALGGRAEGLRVTVQFHEDTRDLGLIIHEIVQRGGTIIHLSRLWDADLFDHRVTLKVQGIDRQELIVLLENNPGVQIIDHRQNDGEYEPHMVSPPVKKEVFLIQNLEDELIQFTDSK